MNPMDKMATKDVILVVDDQPNNLKVIASVLGRKYSVSIANSGSNALKILENHTPDLILLDIMMPEMDGFEVCRNIKANENIRHIPVIFLSAKADIEDVIKGFNCGAADYITKPFNPTEVEVRVQNHLNLKHARSELKSAGQKLQELHAVSDKLNSVLSHDLKDSCKTIHDISNLLVDQVKERDFEGIEKYATILQQSSKRAFDLLMNLLEWSRAQTGKMDYNPEYFEMVSLIEEACSLSDDNALQKSITIQKQLPHNLPVFADFYMISTVLRNLISNAIKFTNSGCEIIVSACETATEIVVSVNDNGIGITKERIEKIFSIGESESTPGTTKEKGTGLGLILCKEFVEKHGGRIWVESAEGKGSEFYFAIPASQNALK